MSKEGNYQVDYEDKRFEQVEQDKDAALGELDKTYGDMIDQSDKFFGDQIDASKEWEQTQAKNQQDQTDFAIDQIEQQKEQAQKDYTREQAGAYTDWQKQSNQYGAKAEQQAAQGMNSSGYAESSQVSMYNTYQNRVATARESFTRAVTDFDNAITQARLQNNSAMAEIAFNALQQRLELALQGFQYKNTLVLDRFAQKQQLENSYYARWQDVLQQMNTENALAEEIRRFNFANGLGEFAAVDSGGSSGGGSGGGDYNPRPRPKPEEEEELTGWPGGTDGNKNKKPMSGGFKDHYQVAYKPGAR